MKKFSFLNCFSALIIITIIFGIIYATVQQVYRTSANDPQIQMVRDISSKIKKGKNIDNYFADTINIEQSLSPVAVLYDANGNPVRSSGYLNGKMVQLPNGLFTQAKSKGEYNVTWQPENNVRMAVVLAYIDSSKEFIAVARSLKEIEEREYNLRVMVFIGWIICIAIVLLSAAIRYKNK